VADIEPDDNGLQVDEEDKERDEDGILGSPPEVTALSPTPDPTIELEFNDAEEAEKLSIAMQRCYLVIRDLMLHPCAAAFATPVDLHFLPAYGLTIAQPVSLADIRKHLVRGSYEGSLVGFYADMTLLFDNAMLFNLDHTSTSRQALRLQVVFERMFLETVLDLEHPVLSPTACHGCSTSKTDSDTGEIISCERCSASYHTSCLSASEKALMPPMGKDWLCPGCVEQRGVASVHPLKFARVKHTTLPGNFVFCYVVNVNLVIF
jgi:hypothetical protein